MTRYMGSIVSRTGQSFDARRILTNTGLHGEIPECIGNLTKLTDFMAATNYLTGTLPASISNLNRLSNLYVFFIFFFMLHDARQAKFVSPDARGRNVTARSM